MLLTVKRIKQLILLFEDGLMAILLSATILLAASQIVLRNLFDSGLVWADPTLRIMVLWLALLGAIAATREDRHIRIDLFSHRLSKRSRFAVSFINNLFSAFICGIITWHAIRFVYMEWLDGVKLFASLPAWLGEIIIPIGFGIMTLRFLFNIPLQLLQKEGE
ncbi:MAG: TRAP transporter small permease [Candidatus Thiodiazotropha endolucinida]|uniref:TRAP transporter small permease protein n=2 Tax=Candidatus Thiodiazotropha TaxID=1913444 RepID=A0A7Z0VPJ7_9GAMM|nr:TRAP transporter small permease [Candidatus Thiodiazotropha endolucinida]MBT3016914.1 TRAP transporter small permease [Candidatus Thiodiazotropha taylori]MBT3032706.1 TRAP transporter small permease [Candidatus Thiodiazotropha sp. (ex Lucina pensylvanica)]MBT3040561.1 TRAP transporter small permease [Candidatus Thiodiazotropha sp. (ex Codakia orbicularis)]MBT3043931.1 TRAP transporter small permease [Candidatus Thiodiazotropha sp. (ex Codakia orbicularis)]MBT3052135.1 TRAP transporter small